MQELVQGIHYFQNTGFSEHAELFGQLKHGQHPEALLITCADSRIVPTLITHARPGQLFIVRNVGNIVPCYGAGVHGELAAVEYAVASLGIEDVIVCGHTGCGAMTALVQPAAPEESCELRSVHSWLRHADATLQIMKEHYGHLQGEELVNAAAEENVLVQLEHLRTIPVMAARVPSGKVRLHGWMYKIETGEVYYYDNGEGQFVKFGQAAGGTGVIEEAAS